MPTFLHLHRRTASSTSLLMMTGGVTFRSKDLPSSVASSVALTTLQPSLSSEHTRAAAGPATTDHG